MPAWARPPALAGSRFQPSLCSSGSLSRCSQGQGAEPGWCCPLPRALAVGEQRPGAPRTFSRPSPASAALRVARPSAHPLPAPPTAAACPPGPAPSPPGVLSALVCLLPCVGTGPGFPGLGSWEHKEGFSGRGGRGRAQAADTGRGEATLRSRNRLLRGCPDLGLCGGICSSSRARLVKPHCECKRELGGRRAGRAGRERGPAVAPVGLRGSAAGGPTTPGLSLWLLLSTCSTG